MKKRKGFLLNPALYAKSQAKTWLFAERVGFKPTVRLGRTPDFESGPFDHSGIFPSAKVHIFLIVNLKVGKKNPILKVPG